MAHYTHNIGETAPERAILVSVQVREGRSRATDLEEDLMELGRLASTAGADVVGTFVQRVQRRNPAYLMGSGKVEELVEKVKSSEATLVIFDDELSPVQGKNLEKALDVRVMDRAELILDIFAIRAKTKEAKLEVELAQLEYMLPRLARMWTHLSRIRGGIGLRGPGETQIETDRRLIRRRVGKLKRDLKDVARHREVLRKRRDRRGVRTAVLVGYTNAGKSSLLRGLSGADVLVEDRLFATLDTTTREVVIPPDKRVRLVDTVGFIRKLPHHLVASFRATLEEATDADILLHVIDASHENWEHQLELVEQTLADIGLQDVTVIHVFNKMDRVEGAETFREIARSRFEHSVFTSAAKKDFADLRNALSDLASGVGAGS